MNFARNRNTLNYKIKFSNGRQTMVRFSTWADAESYLKNALGWNWSDKLCAYSKNGIKAEIVHRNGLPF